MIEQLLTEHLDTWTQAIETKSAAGRGSSKKLNLLGIKKLRELILELAVRGQLVPQDESDEPAEVLLARIAAERERLVREEKLKTKAKESIAISEHYISKPHGWEYIRLGNLAKFIDYRGRTPKKIDSGVPLITAKNIKFGFISSEPAEFISSEDYDEWMTRGFPKVNDVLFTTEAPLGNVALINLDYKFALAQRAICFQFHDPDIAPFLVYLIMSKTFRSQLNDNATGMTAKGVKSSKLKEIPVILPPIQEQKRIVTKVDELMALCDALEQEQESSNAAHGLLVENLLAALTNAANQGEFKQAWARVAAHFDTLFTTEQSVEQLKQTILQLAVMGKLVEQDPADEPAGVLIDRVKDKRELLINSKIIKKRLPVQEIQEEPDLFELPKSWSWFRAAEVFTYITDGEHSTPQRVDDSSEVALVTAKNVRDGYMDYLQTDFVSREIATKCWGRCKPEPGDVLMVSVGATLGRLTVLKKPKDMVIVRSVTIFKMSEVDSDYLSIALNSITAQRWIWNNIKQSAQPCLYLSKSNNIPLPIPPLSEQKRIVKRVDQLMAFCDRLKVDIGKAKNTQIQVANTLTKLVS